MPSLWWFDLRDALIINERRGRLTEAECASFLRNLARRMGLALATLDAGLTRAAQREHVRLLEEEMD